MYFCQNFTKPNFLDHSKKPPTSSSKEFFSKRNPNEDVGLTAFFSFDSPELSWPRGIIVLVLGFFPSLAAILADLL